MHWFVVLFSLSWSPTARFLAMQYSRAKCYAVLAFGQWRWILARLCFSFFSHAVWVLSNWRCSIWFFAVLCRRKRRNGTSRMKGASPDRASAGKARVLQQGTGDVAFIQSCLPKVGAVRESISCCSVCFCCHVRVHINLCSLLMRVLCTGR